MAYEFHFSISLRCLTLKNFYQIVQIFIKILRSITRVCFINIIKYTEYDMFNYMGKMCNLVSFLVLAFKYHLTQTHIILDYTWLTFITHNNKSSITMRCNEISNERWIMIWRGSNNNVHVYHITSPG